MSTHTDRIRQMAQEAHNWTAEAMMSDASLIDPEAWSTAMYARFAQLVAEDCARACDDRAVEMAGFTEEEHASQHLAAAIRARYSLKD